MRDPFLGYPFHGSECVFFVFISIYFSVLHIPRIHVHVDRIATLHQSVNINFRLNFFFFHLMDYTLRLLYWEFWMLYIIHYTSTYFIHITSYNIESLIIHGCQVTLKQCYLSHIFSALHTNHCIFGTNQITVGARFEWLVEKSMIQIERMDFVVVVFQTMPFNLGLCLLHLKLFEIH